MVVEDVDLEPEDATSTAESRTGSLDVDVADQLLGKIDEIARIFAETKKA